MAKPLSHLPERLHHHAYVVKDQEKNRQFFEDVLGIPLAATWCERHFSPWVKRDVAFCHTFYALGDGGALAVFDELGFREHLTPQRSNGLRAMVERIRSDARQALAIAS